jgi:hypothetical protein
MNNIILLSGDVHFAQLYENRCKSLTGQERLIEVCSSGMSHYMAPILPDFGVWTIIPRFWQLTDWFVDLNYGNILIDKHGNVSTQILNIKGEVVLSEVLSQEKDL